MVKGAATPDPTRPDKPVSAAYLGTILGISERAIRELARKGIVPRTPEGTYPIRASVLGYCTAMREAASGRGSEGSTSGLTMQRKRLVREQADKAELANQLTRRELVPAAEVESEWAKVAIALRARLLALPARVHQRLVHLTSAEVATIDREVRDALTELGQGSPTPGPDVVFPASPTLVQAD